MNDRKLSPGMISSRPTVRWRKIGVFAALAYGLAWSLAFTYFALGGRLGSLGFVALGIAFMFTPAIAAVIAQRLLWKQPWRELGLAAPQWRWLLAAWLLPLALMLATIALSLAFPGVHLVTGLHGLYGQLAGQLSPDQLSELHARLDHSVLAVPGVLPLLFALQVLGAGATINAVAAFGEELGWRGLLAHELREMGFWSASLLTGLIWGVWHLPLIIHGYNYPGHPVVGPIMMTLMTVLISPLIGYIRFRAQSVFAAAVFHGMFNAAATLVILVRGGDSMTVGFTGTAGLITLGLADLALWFYLRNSSIPRSTA